MKSHLKIIIVLAMGIALGFSLALAGGSFFTGETLLPVLEQQPELAKYLKETLDLSASGGATRIGTNVSQALGGARVGPYELYAKPKGSKGPYLFHLTVNTDLKFYDKDDKLIPKDKGAVGAEGHEEKLVSITMEVLNPADRKFYSSIPVWDGKK